MKKHIFYRHTISYLLLTVLLAGCGQQIPYVPGNSVLPQKGQSAEGDPVTPPSAPEQSGSITLVDETERIPGDASVTVPPSTSLRDNTPVCLVPQADGIAETHNDVARIDYSNASCGYVMARYTGDCPKVKLRITGPDSIVYTYDLHGSEYETFPFSSGDGSYDVAIYENISGTSYSTCLFKQVQVTLEDEFAPFLFPNQYVNFNTDSLTVAKGKELAALAENDLEVVGNIYNYMISEITYDYDKASDPPTGYTTDVDEILNSGTGICLDYAAVMASMLRSQRIPTRLEVGYAQDAYHAWISIYTEETGWLNGIIEFNGSTWTLVDPTFGANTDDKTLKKFIGDGSNYVLQKMY